MKIINKFLVFFCLLIFSLVPIFWFLGREDILINGVDTNFPLDPIVWFERRFFVWNSIANAGIDFSASVAGLFFHFIQVVPYAIGLNLQTTQLISFIFWFSLIVFSSYLLAKQVTPKRPLIQLLFVCLYSFNIFLFNTWENVKVANLSLMASIPSALSILILLKDSKITKTSASLYLIFVGIIVTGTGINPAYFISFFLVLILYLLSEILISTNKNFIIARIKNFSLLTIIIVLVNFYWILPTGVFIFRNIPTGGSIDKIGFHNWIDSLSQNTSLLNVMRMQGAWDWYAFDSATGFPLYIPYALNYFHNSIFIIFSFLITALAILGLLFHERLKSQFALHFGMMLIIGVFLGSGTHLPTGDLFRWLINHIPFFSLFRSPWYIFTPLVILSLAGLVSLFFDKLSNLYESQRPGQDFRIYITIKSALSLGIVIFIIGNLFYSYPLLTGKIFRPSQPNNFLVKFPDYIFEAGKWLSTGNRGRVIGYPDNEIEEFTWGYRGIESILSLMVDRDVLFSPLNAPDSPVAILIRDFYMNLKKGQVDSAKSIAAKLNIGIIHQKNDQKSITLALPKQVKNLEKNSFGPWDFYIFPGEEFLPKIFTTTDLYLANLTNKDKSFFNALSAMDLLLDSQDKVVEKIPGIKDISHEVILSNNSQFQEFQDFQLSPSKLVTRLKGRDLSTCTFSFDIPKDGTYEPMIEKYHLEDFGIDLSQGLVVELDGQQRLWKTKSTSDSYLKLEPTFLSKGSHIIVLKLINNNLVVGGDFESGISFFKGGEGKGEGIYEIDATTPNKFLSITNIDKADISADFQIKSFDPLGFYYVETKYKQIYGNNTNLLVAQSNKNTLFKVQVERMPNHPEWKLASFYYEPVKVDSQMYVELLAPHVSDPLGTKILYDDVKVQKVFTNQLLFVEKLQEEGEHFLSQPQIKFTKKFPTKYEASINNADKPHVLVFSENYSPDWTVEAFDNNGNKLQLKQLHFSANLYANAWYLEGTPNEYTLIIHYAPQRLFLIGIFVSSLTIIIISFLVIKNTFIFIFNGKKQNEFIKKLLQFVSDYYYSRRKGSL